MTASIAPAQRAKIEALKAADTAARRLASDLSSWLAWEVFPPSSHAQRRDYKTSIRLQMLDLANHVYEATKDH